MGNFEQIFYFKFFLVYKILKMKCRYQETIQENKKIINEVTQSANALRNEVNSYWRQLEEEGKEQVKEDYQLAYDNYVKMDNVIIKI